MNYTTKDDISISESKLNDTIMKKLDKNYHSYKRSELVLDKKGKVVVKNYYVNIYSSGCIGSNIRDATTGIYHDFKVGSTDEYRFFSVADCTGTKSRSSIIFFYQSPRQYEIWHKLKLNDDVHSRWNTLQTQFDL